MFSAFLQSAAHLWTSEQYERAAELVMEDAYTANASVQAVSEHTIVFLLSKPPQGVSSLVRPAAPRSVCRSDTHTRRRSTLCARRGRSGAAP
jgi:hypothetical protein